MLEDVRLLSDTSQERLAAAFADVTLDDCYVYHWFDVPDGGSIVGSWDLRQHWRAYLGDVDFRGLRVFEVGPGSGYLSLMMEAAGAKVVAFDLPAGTSPDILPPPGQDISAVRRGCAATIDRVRNSWWFFHRMFGSNNKAVYGDVYNLPAGVGRFDAATLTAVLLHLSNPFEAIRQVASITDGMIVVTDLFREEFGYKPYLEFSPYPSSQDPMCWWHISPVAVARMLEAVGFRRLQFSYHQHRHHRDLDPEKFSVMPFFTIVGRR